MYACMYYKSRSALNTNGLHKKVTLDKCFLQFVFKTQIKKIKEIQGVFAHSGNLIQFVVMDTCHLGSEW